MNTELEIWGIEQFAVMDPNVFNKIDMTDIYKVAWVGFVSNEKIFGIQWESGSYGSENELGSYSVDWNKNRNNMTFTLDFDFIFEVGSHIKNVTVNLVEKGEKTYE